MTVQMMQEDAYRRIFETIREALLLFELEGQLLACNPAACRLFGYTTDEFRHLRASRLFHPDSLPLLDQLEHAIASGQTFQGRGIYVRKDGSTFAGEVSGTHFTGGDHIQALAIIRDVTLEVEARQLLDQRVAEQTRELETQLQISHNLTLTLDLESLLALILDQLMEVVPYHGATILVVEGDRLVTRAYRGPAPLDVVLRAQFPIDEASSQEVLNSQQSVIVDDMQHDDLMKSRSAPAARELFETVLGYVRGWMATPIHIKGRAVGILVVHHREPGAFTGIHAGKMTAFANQAAVAIENARLYESKHRRAEQFRIVSEVGQRITSILNLDALLSQTVHLIQEAFGYYHIHIGLVEDEYVLFKPSAGVWGTEPGCHCCIYRMRVGEGGLSGKVATTGEPVLIPNVRQDARYSPITRDETGSNVVLPLKVKGQTIGVLNVESKQISAFDADDLIVLQLLANQIAAAIDNARLYEQARQLAALQERQNLARELHDSVSQALYGIALGARTARTLLDQDPVQLRDPLDYVLALAEGALDEMRALIFELRPESLAEEGLVAALEKQAAVLRARKQITVNTVLMAEPDISLEAKHALYRIAQEGLHNISKHARASRVELRLQPGDGELVLEVRDDGFGFDADASFPGHLGLKSMQERAEKIGGSAIIDSQIGVGTTIVVHFPTRLSSH